MEKNALFKLAHIFGKQQLITDPAELLVYERDAALDRGMPDAVVLAHSQEDVQQLAQWSKDHGVPIISRGAGTGLSGGAVAEFGGVILGFSRMNRILHIDPVGLNTTVEPGVVNLTLDEKAREFGLYFPPDPASGRSSTLGGNVAENAGGPHCFKYGVTTNYILGLEFVLPGGKKFSSGGYALDYPEFDWNGLLTGSEGALGIIVKIIARLIRQPPGVMTMMVAFESVEAAGAAVSAIISAGLVPATMEMMDQKITKIVEDFAHPGLSTEAGALLIIEVDGYLNSLQAQMDEISTILLAKGGYDLRIADTPEARERIWYARKSAAGAMARLAPAYLLVDGTVPRSALAQALETSNQICQKYNLQVGYVFHAGDGNLHPLILTDVKDPQHLQKAYQAGGEFLQTVVALGGSITGEHGVGIEKRAFMPLMYNDTEIGVMQDVKQVLDPHELLNPGKIFPSINVPEKSVVPSIPETPTVSFAPSSADQAAKELAVLSSREEPVFITGGVPTTSTSDDRCFSTHNLQGIHAFAPQDQYITVGSGTKIEEVRSYLQEKGWQIALKEPWAGATIGGVLASNFNSPLRIRYGALRDQVLAMTVVLADGRIIRAGRPVVKNVAGYDLPKVFIGSHGTLGCIVKATLKLYPLPRVRRSLLAPVEQLSQGLEWAQKCLPLALVCSGIILGKSSHRLAVQTSPYFLAYSAEGLPADVKSEIGEVRELLAKLGAPEPVEMDGNVAVDHWNQFLRHSWEDSLTLKSGLPFHELSSYLQDVDPVIQAGDFLLDAASGLLYFTKSKDSLSLTQQHLHQLRQLALAAGGYTIVLGAPAEYAGQLDWWGYQPSTRDLMTALKARWDPQGILRSRLFRSLVAAGE